jgi:hypothetical protein
MVEFICGVLLGALGAIFSLHVYGVRLQDKQMKKNRELLWYLSSLKNKVVN